MIITFAKSGVGPPCPGVAPEPGSTLKRGSIRLWTCLLKKGSVRCLATPTNLGPTPTKLRTVGLLAMQVVASAQSESAPRKCLRRRPVECASGGGRAVREWWRYRYQQGSRAVRRGEWALVHATASDGGTAGRSDGAAAVLTLRQPKQLCGGWAATESVTTKYLGEVPSFVPATDRQAKQIQCLTNKHVIVQSTPAAVPEPEPEQSRVPGRAK